jgi:transcriptional regulator with XRE-family HTH domain
MQRTQRDRVPAERRRFVEWLSARIAGRTYGQIAAYMGTDASSVQRWATGHNVPSRTGILKIAAYFRVPPEEVAALLPSPLDAPPRKRYPEEEALAEDIAERVADRVVARWAELERQMDELGLDAPTRASIRDALRPRGRGERAADGAVPEGSPTPVQAARRAEPAARAPRAKPWDDDRRRRPVAG